jgi:DNA-directed RNA polymerase specialized sigma24 family protein
MQTNSTSQSLATPSPRPANAFVAVLEYLPPRPRAVLILRDVLGFSAKDVSRTLGTTVASVNSALQRARRVVAEQRPDESSAASRCS